MIGLEEELEWIYGRAGDWVRLLGRSEGYVGAGLRLDVGTGRHDATLDPRTSETACETFRNVWRSEYKDQDDRCKWPTEVETPHGPFLSPGDRRTR